MKASDSLIDLALEQRLITPKQHRHIVDELALYPNQTADRLLVKRLFLTQAQVDSLRAAMLEAAKRARQSTKAAPNDIRELLSIARSWGASDLHINVGGPPSARINGELIYLDLAPLTAEQTERLLFGVLEPAQREVATRDFNLDFSFDIPGIGRHRCNIFQQRLGWDGIFRLVPNKIPTFEQLGLPPVMQTFCHYPQGLILVTGPAGSGKTATLAAMVDLINKTTAHHIITLEDPIEFVHQPVRCQITQREIGPHSASFATALRASLREDPDIIMVGEMRDLETISIAISAAETGHLVLGTLHTGSAPRTISRILDAYPPQQRDQILLMISESLRGVISQLLIRRKDGKGRVLALEVLVVTLGVSALIKEGKTYQLASTMQSSRKQGMIVMDESLMELLKQDLITAADAYRYSENKQPFENLQKGAG